MEIVVLNESARFPDSADGVTKALPEPGEKPFFILDSDIFRHGWQTSNPLRLTQYLELQKMDVLLLTVTRQQICGHKCSDVLTDKKDSRPCAIARGRPSGIRPEGRRYIARTVDMTETAEKRIYHQDECI